MSMWRRVKHLAFLRGLVTLAIVAACAMPVQAQFSDSYLFLKAVRDKDINKANDILKKPGNTLINTRDRDSGETALIIAAKRSDLGWIGYLLQQGADANARDRDGNSPLILASISGFVEGARVLLYVKARVDLQNSLGETALIKAVQARDGVLTKMLLDAGANPDLTDNAAGYSARQYGAQDGRTSTASKLIHDAPARQKAVQQGPSL